MTHPNPLDIVALLSKERSLSLDSSGLASKVKDLEHKLQNARDDVTMVTRRIGDAEQRLDAIKNALPALERGMGSLVTESRESIWPQRSIQSAVLEIKGNFFKVFFMSNLLIFTTSLMNTFSKKN